MNDNNKPMDVCIGEKFLELARIPGGFYASKEKKTELVKVSDFLDAPQFVYIILDGNAPFPSTLFCEFRHKYYDLYLSDDDIELVVNDFERVCQPEEIIGKYRLSDLNYEDRGNGPVKEGDLIVSIELKRVKHAGMVMALFNGIKTALISLSCENMPYTYSSNDLAENYNFKFFSSDTSKDFNEIAKRMNQELRLKDWEVNVQSGPDKEAGKLYSWELSAERCFSNAAGF